MTRKNVARLIVCLAVVAVGTTPWAAQDDIRPRLCGRVLSLTCGAKGPGLLLLDVSDNGSVQEIKVPRELIPGLLTQLGTVVERRLVCLRNVGALSPPVMLDSAVDLIVTEEREPTLVGDRVFSTCDPSVRQPVVIREVKPFYSATAFAAGISGTVVVHGMVAQSGLLHDARVVRSLERSLDAEAVKAFSQWQFRPAMRGGSAVAVPVSVDMTFTVRRR
jgi:TonB family protein